MKQLSNAFIQALNDDEREYLAYATIQLMDGTILELTNEEIWTSGFRYEESVSDDNSFSALGSAIIGSASLIINNIYDTYSDYDFTNARVILSIGIQNAEDILQIGRYRVDDTNYNGATIQLTLLDNMAEFDRPYSISTLAYPTSLRRIVYDACLNCGMALATVDFPNGDFIVDNRPSDESTTFRDVVAWSAALAGCFAKINIRGNLEFAWFNRTALEAVDVDSPTFHPWDNEELYNANGVHYLYSLNSQNICVDDIIITGVTVHVKSEDDTETDNDILAYSYGESGYVEGDLENDGTGYIILISDNPFITKTNARQVVTSLGTKLLGFRFRKLNITQESDPSIESGDVAIVIDRKLNKYKTLITRNSFGIGSSQTIVCGAETPLRNSGTQSSATTKAYVEARKLFKKSISATDDALNSAIAAAQAAHEAQDSADWALASARSANNSANSALTQLGVVEDVAGTLNWIRENGTFVPTTDVKLNPTTVYFTYENGEYVPVVAPDINVNPMAEGWYVLDVTASQSEYIMAHLAVTEAGLWVLPFNTQSPHPLVDSADYNLIDSDENQLVDWSKDPKNAAGYKVLLASDGMTVYNADGTPIANYGETTTIGSALLRNVHIDENAVYIRDGQTKLASYGSSTIFYKPDGVTKAVEIDSNGIDIKTGHIGGFQINGQSLSRTVTYDGVNYDTLAFDTYGINFDNLSALISYFNSALLIECSEVDINSGYSSVVFGTNGISVENEQVESQIVCSGDAGTVYMYSQGYSGTGNRGVYSMNSSGTYKAVIDIGQNNICYFRGPADSVSDLKKKDVISDYEWKIDEFIRGLKPIAYKRKYEDGTLGDRIHMGFGAQDVSNLSKILYDEDLSLYRARIIDESKEGPEREQEYHGEDIDDSKLSWSLVYEELIAPMVLEIQRLMNRVDELEAKVKEMEE